MKVLIIADEQKTNRFLSKYFEQKNHSVFPAFSEESALEIIEKNHAAIDAIILISLNSAENQNHLDFLKKLREKDNHTQIIQILDQKDADVITETFRNGANDVFHKPINYDVADNILNKLETNLTLKESLKIIEPYYSETIEYQIPSQISFVSACCASLRQQLKGFCLLKKLDLHKISLCVQEAIANAIIHGNLNISSKVKEESWDDFENLIIEREKDPELSQKKVIVRCTIGNNQLKFSVEDEGEGFDRSTLPEPNDPNIWLSPSGRGIIIIRSFMDEVEWNDVGNKISITKFAN